MVMFASNGAHAHGEKDTARNVQETKEFVCNMATWDLGDAVKKTSQPVDHDVDEFELAGLPLAPSKLVAPPRVASSPIQLECRLVTTFALPDQRDGTPNTLLVGRVLGVHINDEVLDGGLIDISRLRPLARLGYDRFGVVDAGFTLPRASHGIVHDAAAGRARR